MKPEVWTQLRAPQNSLDEAAVIQLHMLVSRQTRCPASTRPTDSAENTWPAPGRSIGKFVKPLDSQAKVCVDVHIPFLWGQSLQLSLDSLYLLPTPLFYSSIAHIPCWAPILLPSEAAILMVKVG